MRYELEKNGESASERKEQCTMGSSNKQNQTKLYASPIKLLIHILWVSYLKTKNNDLLTPVKKRFNLFLS
jgi:hypothetical protein